MRLQLQQEENQFRANQEDKGDSHRKDDRQGPTTPNEPNSDLLREMRKEMDKLRNAIREKTDQSLDRMVRTTDSPFIAAVLECLVPSKFRLPQLELFDGLKDPLDHLNTFKTTLGLQQPPNEILCRPLTASSNWAMPFCTISLGDNAQRGQQTIYSPLDKRRKRS